MTRTRSISGGKVIRHRRGMTGLATALVGLLVVGVASPAAAIGEPDPSFSGDGRQTVDLTPGIDGGYAAAVQEDGKILAAGEANGQMFLARYNTDGSPDTSFSGDGRAFVDYGPKLDYASDIAIDGDGNIVIVGSAKDSAAGAIARFTPAGVLDTTFSGDGRRTINFSPGIEFGDDLVIDDSGRIVVGGLAVIGGFDRFSLSRFNPDGSVDTTFSGDGWVTTDIGPGHDFVMALAIQQDGKLVATGLSGGQDQGADERVAVVRYDIDGSLDPTFSGDGMVTRNTVAGYEDAAAVSVQADGKIVVAGESAQRLLLLRYSTTGVLDPTFSGDGIHITDRPNTPEWISDIRLQDDGDIVFSGGHGGGGGRMLLGRFLASGAPDTSFSGDGFALLDFSPNFDVAWDVAIAPDGAVVGVGSANNGNKLALGRVVGG